MEERRSRAGAPSEGGHKECTVRRLWQLLRKADVSLTKEQKNHDVFGNMQKVIDSFISSPTANVISRQSIGRTKSRSGSGLYAGFFSQ